MSVPSPTAPPVADARPAGPAAGPALSPWLVGPGLLVLAAAAGVLATRDPVLALGVAIAVAVLVAMFVDSAVALGAWAVLSGLGGLPGTARLPTAILFVMVAVWAATLAARSDQLRRLRSDAPVLLLAIPLLLLVMTLSALLVAGDRGVGLHTVQRWVYVLAALVIVMTAADSRRALLFVAGGYVSVGLIAVLAALASPNMTAGVAATESASATDGRLQAGNLDPNYLAAVLVPAIVLLLAWASVVRRAALKVAAGSAALLLLFGLVATQSRGGFIALAVAVVVALVVIRDARPAIGGLFALALVIAGVFLALNPAWTERLTADDGSGSGRSDIWKVASHVARDHPLLGVGPGNLVLVEPSYSLSVGKLEAPELIVDDPKVAHNVLLQSVAENGVPGLVLLLTLFGGCLAGSVRAARRFRAAGERRWERGAQALLVAQVSTLAASLFLSNADENRLWILLALGPAAAVVASRAVRRDEADDDGPGRRVAAGPAGATA